MVNSSLKATLFTTNSQKDCVNWLECENSKINIYICIYIFDTIIGIKEEEEEIVSVVCIKWPLWTPTDKGQHRTLKLGSLSEREGREHRQTDGETQLRDFPNSTTSTRTQCQQIKQTNKHQRTNEYLSIHVSIHTELLPPALLTN